MPFKSPPPEVLKYYEKLDAWVDSSITSESTSALNPSSTLPAEMKYDKLAAWLDSAITSESTSAEQSPKTPIEDICEKVAGVVVAVILGLLFICGIFRVVDWIVRLPDVDEMIAKYNQEEADRHHFEILKLKISRFEMSSDYEVSGECEVNFNVTYLAGSYDNNIMYDKGLVGVYYGDSFLWSATTKEFYQGPNTTDLVNVKMENQTVSTPEFYVLRGLVQNRKLSHLAEFKVRFYGWVRRGLGRGRPPFVQGIRILCEVEMHFENDRTLVGGPKTCRSKLNDF